MEEKITYKTRRLRAEPTEEHLWEVVLLYQKVKFKTYSGLPFSYEMDNTRKNYGLTAGKRVRVWHGVLFALPFII